MRNADLCPIHIKVENPFEKDPGKALVEIGWLPLMGNTCEHEQALSREAEDPSKRGS
jgi:hypothetical protein